MDTPKTAWLALETGDYYEGIAIGANGETFGELVFNTSMTGYQEILTDPSYKGQVVLFTYPEIGNYGVNADDVESGAIHAQGLVVRQLTSVPSSWQAAASLEQWLIQKGIIGIAGVDTRAITRSIRTQGSLKCGITTNIQTQTPKAFINKVKTSLSLEEQALVAQVTTPVPFTLKGTGCLLERLVVLDFGIKQSIIEGLKTIATHITVLPAFSSFEVIQSYQPTAVFLSNGPGDPNTLKPVIQTVKRLIDWQTPLFGICLGHQLLALAMGLGVEKMPFGHHGGNHPVKDLALNKLIITAQNHGYCVAPVTDAHLAQSIIVTHVNLNDGTIEGIKHATLPICSVQFHPEASPGPTDAAYLFEQLATYCLQKASSSSVKAMAYA
jgi:carbamoyl-phosphate synthase small subunit